MDRSKDLDRTLIPRQIRTYLRQKLLAAYKYSNIRPLHMDMMHPHTAVVL